ncbi:MAG: lipid II flippase MurJ, partial [Pseudomonadota bacterium]
MTRAPIRILTSFGTVGGWTMLSRILGFVRDILMGALVGTGPVAEAFIVAFRLPNMFRRFFAEGAFNLAFIPLFSKKLSAEGEDAARDFAEEALSVLLTILIALTVVAQAVMPWLVWVLAGGFEAGSTREELAILFSRICFPYVVFISLAALFS